MTTDNFCFYLQNRLVQTSQTGGQRYSDTSPFSIPWPNHSWETRLSEVEEEKAVYCFLLKGYVTFTSFSTECRCAKCRGAVFSAAAVVIALRGS
jgi:hypothetical protein